MTRIQVPILVVSEANQRGHWAKTYARKKTQQAVTAAMLVKAEREVGMPDFPVSVQLTRYGPGVLDSDGLTGAFKHVRDSIAKFYQVDDGDKRWQWLPPKQEKAKRKDAAILIEIESITQGVL